MKTYSFKKILDSREAQPTRNAFSGNLGILVDNSNQEDDVDVLISRLNSGDASYVHESWQKLTGGFDLDTIERIINGIEDDAMLDAIVRIIKSEYLRLVKQGKIEAISRKKDYSGRGICVYDACFEELINDFITHRKEIKEALQNEKEEREKAASFFSIFYNEEDRKKRSCADAYEMSIGLARRLALDEEMALFSDAVRDEYSCYDAAAAERLEDYAASRKDKDLKRKS